MARYMADRIMLSVCSAVKATAITIVIRSLLVSSICALKETIRSGSLQSSCSGIQMVMHPPKDTSDKNFHVDDNAIELSKMSLTVLLFITQSRSCSRGNSTPCATPSLLQIRKQRNRSAFR